jgi:hypothetical protein
MINSKLTKTAEQQNNEERLFKLLESMDWKLWEMMNMMKDHLSPEVDKKPKPAPKLKKATDQKTD